MPETSDQFTPVDPKLRKAVLDRLAPKDKINLVKIQCIFPAHVIYTGAISGQRYDFPGPGSVLDVDDRDIPAMLAYRIGTTNCCGGGNVDGNRVFQVL